MMKDKIIAVWQRLTEPPASLHGSERRYQARLLASIVLSLLLLGIISTVATVASDPERSLLRDPQMRIMLFSAAGALLAYLFGRSKSYLVLVYLILFLGLFAIYLSGYSDDPANAHSPLYSLSILILISGFLLPLRYAALFAIITLAPMPFFPLVVPAVPLQDILIGPFNLVSMTIATTLLVSHYRNQLEQYRQQQLTQVSDELAHHADQLTALHEISLNIISQHDINELLQAITTRAATLLGVAGGSIYLVNSDDDILTLTAVYGPSQELQGAQLKRGEGMAGRILITAQPQIVSDYDQGTNHAASIPPGTFGSVIQVPILSSGKVIGVLSCQETIGIQRTFTEADIQLLERLARLSAIALQNANLYEETRRHTYELETLAQISASLRTAKTVHDIMPILLQETVEAVNATYSVLFLVDPETGELVSQMSSPPGFYRAGLRQSPGDGITGHVATTREIYISEDIVRDPLTALLPGELDSLERTQSSISVPVQTPDQLVGVIHIASAEKRVFTEADVHLLTAISNIAANALDRATVMDTLEERVAERTRELAQANVRLTELDALKTKFISDISHELRTPVATLNLYMDLLERGKPEKKLQYMQILRQKTNLLVRLTEDILNVSRINLYEGKLKFTAVNLNDTIAIVIAMHQERAQAADIKLTFAPAPNLPLIRAERNQLMQAITTIVSNALDYTPAGSIQVSTFLQSDPHQACLQISDTGIGIEPDDVPHIFERFYRGHQVAQSTKPGTGLGLAIAKEILDLHNGSIEVESDLGRGTTFRIKWPLANGEHKER